MCYLLSWLPAVMLHVERLMPRHSDRCTTCGSTDKVDTKAYCRACAAKYMREFREDERQTNAAKAKRHQQYFEGIEDETLP